MNTNSRSATAQQPAAADQPADAPAPGGDLGVVLATLALLMHETVAKFERATGRVSDMVVAKGGRADPGLVVALQDFDRLQQEFSALGEVLARIGAAGGNVTADDLKHELLSGVTVADLKHRLSLHFAQPETDGMSLDDLLVAEF